MALACEGAIEYRGGFRAYHDYRLTLRHYTKTEVLEGLKKWGGISNRRSFTEEYF